MEIVRLESSDNDIFKKVCEWNHKWWGIRDNKSYEDIEYVFSHCLNSGSKLPQTFVAISDGIPAGMYQLSMRDDLDSRPDIYPWLINVFVDEKYRGRNICRELMLTVKENAAKASLTELYLYTNHIGLYEKFGWQFIEEVRTFRKESPIERLYKMEIESENEPF